MSLIELGALAAAVLALAALTRLVWMGFRFFNSLSVLVKHELSHNGGKSTKDYAKKAAEDASEALMLVKEATPMLMAHERELGSLQARVKALEEA